MFVLYSAPIVVAECCGLPNLDCSPCHIGLTPSIVLWCGEVSVGPGIPVRVACALT
jgi:hypothetical protein